MMIKLKRTNEFKLNKQIRKEKQDLKMTTILKEDLRRHLTECNHFLKNLEVQRYLNKCEVY